MKSSDTCEHMNTTDTRYGDTVCSDCGVVLANKND